MSRFEIAVLQADSDLRVGSDSWKRICEASHAASPDLLLLNELPFGPWIAAGDFNSRFGLELALKDVRLGVEMAQAWGNESRTMQVALDYLKQGYAEGLGKEDCNAIYKIIK